jgi:hypothetical protein
MVETLEEARPGSGLQVNAASIHAVAHAFAMLGLLTPEDAEAALTQASRALELRGVSGSGLGAGPTRAGDYWRIRAQGRPALTWIPRAVAPGALRLSVGAADVRCDWFRVAQAGLRFQVQAAAVGQQPPSRHVGMSAWGEDIQLHMYGWPWIQSQHWPAAIPCFKIRAIDDHGGERSR